MSIDRWVDNIPGGYPGDSDSEMGVEIEDRIVTLPRRVRDPFQGTPVVMRRDVESWRRRQARARLREGENGGR